MIFLAVMFILFAISAVACFGSMIALFNIKTVIKMSPKSVSTIVDGNHVLARFLAQARKELMITFIAGFFALVFFVGVIFAGVRLL